MADEQAPWETSASGETAPWESAPAAPPDAAAFQQQVGRAPSPDELASWQAHPENWAGYSGPQPSAGSILKSDAQGAAGLATSQVVAPVGQFLTHVGTLLATQDP